MEAVQRDGYESTMRIRESFIGDQGGDSRENRHNHKSSMITSLDYPL